MASLKEYKNGLRLIVNKMNSYSVGIGFIVKVGSAGEKAGEEGISHFLEHMMFKGTKKRNLYELAEASDNLGSNINAFTGKEITCYYAKCTLEHFKAQFEILADLFLNSTFPKRELEKEKGVVLEEIAMSEDDNEGYVLTNLSRLAFGNEGYGGDILGTAKNVKGFTQESLKEYIQRKYIPQNIVISISGNVEMEEAEKLVEEFFDVNGEKSAEDKAIFSPTFYFDKEIKNKDVASSSFALAFPAGNLKSEFKNYFSIADAILGGGMSSRLFKKLREDMGLCYTVYSFYSPYENAGSFGIYSAVNEENLQKSYDMIKKELQNFKENGVSKEELERAKQQYKARCVFANESPISLMLNYGKKLIFENEILDLQNTIDQVNKITQEEMNRFLKDNLKIENYASYALTKTQKIVNF